MRFLKYANQDFWWKWPEDGMTVFNINYGHHDIDENNPNFMYGTVVDADSWADLMDKMDWNPWRTLEPRPHMWISPWGEMFDCDDWGAHESIADNIVEHILQMDPDELPTWSAGDYLINYHHWIKVTTGPMYQYYVESNMYDPMLMTEEQYDSYTKWRNKYGKTHR